FHLYSGRLATYTSIEARSKVNKRLEELRSQRWLAPDNTRSFAHRQRLQQMGLRREEFMSRPVIAIVNTWSDLSPCHAQREAHRLGDQPETNAFCALLDRSTPPLGTWLMAGTP